MKILLIGNLPEDGQQSMRRFTALLEAGLRQRGHALSVLAPTLRLARCGPRYQYRGLPKYLGYFDKLVLFPRQLRQQLAADPADVVHFADHASATAVSAAGRTPTLATCHDLLQIRAARGEISVHRPGRAASLHQSWIRRSLGAVGHVACISSETEADALRVGGLKRARVSVVPNALNHPYEPIPVATAYARLTTLAAAARFDLTRLSPARGGFLLQIGGAQWYKNRAGLLTIFAGLRRRSGVAQTLVMVGPPLSVELAALAADLGISDAIIHLPSVTEAQLEALYNVAEGLLFPSWEEGFGWPIAEAQACGCPVFASNRAPMTEVGGPTAFYFNPQESAEAVDTIARAWPQKEARRSAAIAAAVRWQPARMFEAYELLYRTLAR